MEIDALSGDVGVGATGGVVVLGEGGVGAVGQVVMDSEVLVGGAGKVIRESTTGEGYYLLRFYVARGAYGRYVGAACLEVMR